MADSDPVNDTSNNGDLNLEVGETSALSQNYICDFPHIKSKFDPIDFYVNLTILPIVCVFGTLAAVICVIVFTRRQMRSSLNIYLAGLSLFDLILLLFSLVMFVPLQGCIEKGQTNNAVCLFFWYTTPYFLPIINIAQTSSVWACVAVTVDRFLAVKFPLHSKIWCTPKRALAILICITLTSILYRIPVFFELTNDSCGRIMPSNMRKSMRYQKYYIMYGYVLFILLIPWTAMIILNIFVVKAVHRAYKIRRTMQGTKSHEERDRRCTIMALCMVTTFLLFNIVAAINNINEPFQLGLPRQLQPLGNLLVCINSASNIVIYALFGARFRQMCVLMLCGRNSRWMIWLKAGGCRMIVSDWDGKDLTTRKTSLDASTALLSARHSRARTDGTPVLGADGLRLHRLSAASAQLDPQDRHRHACRMTSCSSAVNRSRSGSRKGRTNRRRSNRLRLDGVLLSTLTLPTSVDSRCSSRRSSANSMISIERM